MADDSLNPQMRAILDVLDDRTPTDMYQIAELMGSSYWTIYPHCRKLEEMGFIKAGAFRKDKKKTFLRVDMSRTPRIHTAGGNADPVAIYNLAKGAPLARKSGTETGMLVNNFPYMVLRLYNLAAATSAGHNFDKATYQGIRGDVVGLRNRLENMTGAINELLAHPAMSGDPKLLVDSLMADPDNPLDREAIAVLMSECQK